MSDNMSLLDYVEDQDYTSSLRNISPTAGLLYEKAKEGKLPFVPSPTGLPTGALINFAIGQMSRGEPWDFVKEDADFYIQTVGSNAGKVMKEPSANSIGIKVNQEHLVPDYLYYAGMLGEQSGRFKQRHKGTAQPYITQKDIDDVLTEILMMRNR